ncbi:MAG: hypothetical protein MJZ79_08120 [Paludibacteraceae bacterium]|nr:hypothetical protein [Paludibacteraceae bacterium]
MKTKNFKFKSMALVLFALVLSSNVWGETETYTFTSKSWGATNSAEQTANWTSGKDGNGLTTNQGIQITDGVSGANGTSPISFSNVSKIVVRYCTNASKGVGTIKVQVGSGTEKSFSVTKPSSGGTTLKNAEFIYSTSETGKIKVTGECTTNSVYIHSVIITYSASSCTGLAAPGNPQSANVTANGVTLSWSAVTNATGYTLTVGETEYNVDGTSKTIDNLYPENTYTWNVAAKGDGTTYCENGTATEDQQFTTLAAWTGNTAVYTVASVSSVTPSGDIPTGSDATFANTYTSNKEQITSGKSQTLTLTGFEGKIIKAITLDMHSNGSAGAGTFSVVVGSVTLASIASATTFDKWYDNTSYGTDYRKVHIMLTDENYTVKADETIVITITGTTNSLFCDEFKIGYDEVACTKKITITKGAETNGTFELSQTGEVCIDEGNATVDVTDIQPAEHYHFSQITATNGSVDNENKRVTNISVNTTINVEFAADTKHTISFLDNIQLEEVEDIEVYGGATFTFPVLTDRTAATEGTCEQMHYHFMGWVISTHTGEITVGDIETGTSAPVYAPATYKAVWAAEQ